MKKQSRTITEKLALATFVIFVLFGLIDIYQNQKINTNFKNINELETRILIVEEDGFIGGNFIIEGNATTTGNQVIGTDVDHNVPACIALRTVDKKWVCGYAESASEIINNGLSWTRINCSLSNPKIPPTATLILGS